MKNVYKVLALLGITVTTTAINNQNDVEEMMDSKVSYSQEENDAFTKTLQKQKAREESLKQCTQGREFKQRQSVKSKNSPKPCRKLNQI